MPCRHCEHSEGADTDQVWCLLHKAKQDRDGECAQYERAPGADDDLGDE